MSVSSISTNWSIQSVSIKSDLPIFIDWLLWEVFIYMDHKKHNPFTLLEITSQLLTDMYFQPLLGISKVSSQGGYGYFLELLIQL